MAKFSNSYVSSSSGSSLIGIDTYDNSINYPRLFFRIEFDVQENEFRVIEIIQRYTDASTHNIARVDNKINQKVAYAGSIANCYAYIQARKEGLLK